MAPLAELQEIFLRGLRSSGVSLDAFSPPPGASVEKRWHVYHNAYTLRLVEAIRADYPAVERIVGPGAFRSLVECYLAAFPPHSHDISRAGDGLPTFLAAGDLARELPFLPDLARFEAALARALVAADSSPQNRATLAAIEPLALSDARISLAPGAALVDSAWPLGDLWELRDQPDAEVALQVVDRPSRLLVHREGLAVCWRAVDRHEALFLTAAAAGVSLGELSEDARFGPAEEAAPLVAGLLVRLLEEGAVRIDPPASPPEALVPIPGTPL